MIGEKIGRLTVLDPGLLPSVDGKSYANPLSRLDKAERGKAITLMRGG